MYLFAEIKQLTQYMQSECFFNDFSIMNSAILLKVVSFIVYSWVSSVNSVFLSKHTLYTFYSKERVFSTLYFVFEILLLLRVIVLNIPSKMSQLRKSGSEFYSIEKWHFLQCMFVLRDLGFCHQCCPSSPFTFNQLDRCVRQRTRSIKKSIAGAACSLFLCPFFSKGGGSSAKKFPQTYQ